MNTRRFFKMLCRLAWCCEYKLIGRSMMALATALILNTTGIAWAQAAKSSAPLPFPSLAPNLLLKQQSGAQYGAPRATPATPVTPFTPATSAPPATPEFVLDPTETHSRFEAKFLGFITVRGKFNRTTGRLIHDPARRDAASRANDSIIAEIDATSLEAHVVNAETTNEILRGPQFFNVEKFATITFASSMFKWDGPRLTAIEGTLTLLGVAKPVVLTVEKSGCKPAGPNGRIRCAAEAFVTVKRADFGMKAWAASVSNDVKLMIELVAYSANNLLSNSATDAGLEPKQAEEAIPAPVSGSAIPPTGDRRP